jgi:hypothetical protein
MPRDYTDIIGRKSYRPFSSYIPFDVLGRTFDARGNLISTDLINPRSFDPLNADIDLRWAGLTDDTEKFNTYYDYYFTGEDIKVYIDGLFDPKHELDIANFAYMIRQEKQPVFGFWSYNYDVMMLGTRIISGEFSVYSRYPGRMTDLLSEAAKQRVAYYNGSETARIQSNLLSNSESVDDEKNIEKYWANSQLDRISYDGSNEEAKNIFSAHPPFNFIIKYGTQEGALTTVARNKGTGSEDNFDTLDRLMATDYNERLVKKGTGNKMDIVLQSVQILSMATSYQPGGQPLVETYQFLARDMYISQGTIKDKFQQTESVANDDSSGAGTGTNTTAVPSPRIEEFIENFGSFGS